MSATAVSNIRIIALRDLNDVKEEINAYPDDDSMWAPIPGITNPGGNLALHLAGNMQHYIGVVLGNSKYVRDRPAEFSDRGLSKAQVLHRLDEAINDVDDAFNCLDDSDLEKPYPEPMGEFHLLTGQFLSHCLAHMGYHLGQMDYHRRIATGINQPISAQSVPGMEDIPD